MSIMKVNSRDQIVSRPNGSLLFLLITLLPLIAFSGCGYNVQTRSNLPFDSIEIGKIENKTVEPKLQDMFNKTLSEILYEYGFDIKTHCRYILEGDINSFALEPLVEKSLVATQYRIVIKADFRIKDTLTNKIIPVKIKVPFITTFSSAENLQMVISAKEIATKEAIKNISQEIVRSIVYKDPTSIDKKK